MSFAVSPVAVAPIILSCQGVSWHVLRCPPTGGTTLCRILEVLLRFYTASAYQALSRPVTVGNPPRPTTPEPNMVLPEPNYRRNEIGILQGLSLIHI